MKYLVIVLVNFILGCISFPPYQSKSIDGIGYTVTDVISPSAIQVDVALPESSSTKAYTLAYAFRVVGETCLQRGFPFFDIAGRSEVQFVQNKVVYSLDGYCFLENTRKALGITFQKAESNKFDAAVEVENTKEKSNTKLKIKDLILAVNNVRIKNMNQIKNLVFVESKKSNTLEMSIVRDGNNMKLTENLNIGALSNLGPKDLEDFKKTVK